MEIVKSASFLLVTDGIALFLGLILNTIYTFSCLGCVTFVF